ncbi:hypothetical protein [Photobacterium kishitanii]|uniref:hypothetical protein n=1 Tax=Photobacterium kishitanii TaxID=318456 RepID=UPI0011B209CB|nr:hypothetical protein [Photobacterium kishitanii]
MTNIPCFHCEKPIRENEATAKNAWIKLHEACLEPHNKECDRLDTEIYEQELKAKQNEKKILKDLQNTLKPNLFEIIEFELEQHCYRVLDLVKRKDISAMECHPNEILITEDLPFDHIYSDVTSCDDSYGGDIYIPLGYRNYLKVTIWG